jgi:haloacetate dehalogenase
MTFDTFSREIVDVAAGRVFIRRAGRGPAVLLLHGYPETSLAWRKVAPELASEFTVIAADLPGYGDSILSDDALEDGRNSKRTMGRALADVMSELGISQFAVVGHDRGARVAYRLALDQPERIHAVAVLDVIPILEMAGRLTYEAARQMGHWFWLAQSSTVPETLIGRDPDLYVRHIIDEWGGSDFMEREPSTNTFVACASRRSSGQWVQSTERTGLISSTTKRIGGRLAESRARCWPYWAKGGLTEQFGDPLAIWSNWADHVER